MTSTPSWSLTNPEIMDMQILFILKVKLLDITHCTVTCLTMTGFQISFDVMLIHICPKLRFKVNAEKFPPFSRWLWNNLSCVKFCTKFILHGGAPTYKWCNNKKKIFTGGGRLLKSLLLTIILLQTLCYLIKWPVSSNSALYVHVYNRSYSRKRHARNCRWAHVCDSWRMNRTTWKNS